MAEDEGDDPVVVPIEGSIDLHFFAPRDIPSVVDEYLRQAQRLGFSEVRLIHGKGKGVQRRIVQGLAAGHPLVASVRSDGLGSTLVELHRAGAGQKFPPSET
jgi:DNA-nicking Smr family endonuclease